MKKSILSLLLLLPCFILMGCNSLPVEVVESKYYSQRIKFLVMHYTAIDYQKSVNALVKTGGVSSHYLLPEFNDSSYAEDELKIYQLVAESKRAWHAGNSTWQGRKNLNDSSIGIEIVNVPVCKRAKTLRKDATVKEHGEGRLCLFPDYDPKQIELLIELSKDILARNPDIGPTQVIGHSDIAPTRKNDPGPRFPWYQLYREGIGAWYDSETVERYWQIFMEDQPSIGLVQQALHEYGYEIEETGEYDNASLNTISSFQMHFLPWNVTGKNDAKTPAVLFALLEKYFPKKIDALLARYNQEKQLLQEESETEAQEMQVSE